MTPVTFTVHGSAPLTFDVPAEYAIPAHVAAAFITEASAKPTFNGPAFFKAAMQLAIAVFITKDPLAIAAAVAALLAAITGA